MRRMPGALSAHGTASREHFYLSASNRVVESTERQRSGSGSVEEKRKLVSVNDFCVQNVATLRRRSASNSHKCGISCAKRARARHPNHAPSHLFHLPWQKHNLNACYNATLCAMRNFDSGLTKFR